MSHNLGCKLLNLCHNYNSTNVIISSIVSCIFNLTSSIITHENYELIAGPIGEHPLRTELPFNNMEQIAVTAGKLPRYRVHTHTLSYNSQVSLSLYKSQSNFRFWIYDYSYNNYYYCKCFLTWSGQVISEHQSLKWRLYFRQISAIIIILILYIMSLEIIMSQ